MNNIQNIYNQGPIPPVRNDRSYSWRDRIMNNYGRGMFNMSLKGLMAIPGWFPRLSIVFFFVAMFACMGVWGYIPKFDLVLASCLSVVLFFYGGETLAKKWALISTRSFLKHVLVAGIVVRLIWILYLYFIFNPEYYGNTYGDTADVDWYMPFAKDLAQWITGDSKMTFSQLVDFHGGAIDDVGYPMWLSIIYLLVGPDNDIFIPFIIKAVLGAYCSVSIFHITKRHFGEGAARIAAIFVCLNPNMIYWCGTMMKETEMVFLVCLAIDNFDRVLSSGRKYTFRSLLPGLLSALALLFFRSVLGIVVFLAVFSHIVMASHRVMSLGKKIMAGVLVSVTLLSAVGDQIRTQSRDLLEGAQSEERQEKNLEFRANREGGNSFAKYASTAVFAPLIFTIPFPTFNEAYEGQIVQIQLAGGSYIKNILSFFVIIVIFLMLISGEWRRHVFILAYTVGYHLVLVMSNFAQSGRFHMPVWPMILLFGAYGVQIAKGNRKMRNGFIIALILEVVICLIWNWFKLKGRGMI